MFVQAIQQVEEFTRPIHFITRYYGSSEVVPDSATIFFVNEEGFAITCRHVTDQIAEAEQLYSNFLKFKADSRNIKGGNPLELTKLEMKHRIGPGSIVRIKTNFVGAFAKYREIKITAHPVYDLSLIQFIGIEKPLYTRFARFLANDSQIFPGRNLCRTGYPFPEFNNYRYNSQLDDIEWTDQGRVNSPSFPIDGIVTRRIGTNGKVSEIELSTPGLRGQSGGPLFDSQGTVYGMQSATRHLHLGFDQVNREVTFGGVKKRVSNFPFLSVGRCVSAGVIKDFLKNHHVKFYT